MSTLVGFIDANFRRGNFVECGLWITMAVVVWVGFSRRPDVPRGRVWVAAVTLAAFGVSDYVEANTGAWWRPWWLLLWKTVCVIVLVAVLWAAGRARRRTRQANAERPSL